MNGGTLSKRAFIGSLLVLGALAPSGILGFLQCRSANNPPWNEADPRCIAIREQQLNIARAQLAHFLAPLPPIAQSRRYFGLGTAGTWLPGAAPAASAQNNHPAS